MPTRAPSLCLQFVSLFSQSSLSLSRFLTLSLFSYLSLSIIEEVLVQLSICESYDDTGSAVTYQQTTDTELSIKALRKLCFKTRTPTVRREKQDKLG